MQAALMFVAIALALFVMSFLSKRRFGILGFALAAGAVLSEVWAYEVGLIAGIFRFGSGDLNSFIVTSILLLIPALLLMLHGNSYKSLLSRIFGALAFTVLALAFLAEPLASVLAIDGSMKDAYSRLVNQKELIIGAGLIVATLDMFLAKPSKDKEKKREH